MDCRPSRRTLAVRIAHCKTAITVYPAGQIMLDLVVISYGPIGLALPTESAKLGLKIGLVGPNFLFTNKYGNREDDFKELGLQASIEHFWKDTIVYLDHADPVLIDRTHGRVSSHLLHEELLKSIFHYFICLKGVIHINLPRCVEAGILYLNSKVDSIVEATSVHSLVECEGDIVIPCRFLTVASGAASRKFLQYELGGPRISIQTAYGVEVEVERDHQTLSNSKIFECYAPEYLNATSLCEQIAALFFVNLSVLVLRIFRHFIFLKGVIHIDLPRCVETGVLYLNSKVDRIFEVLSVLSLVECEGDVVIPCSLREILQYELGGPRISVQTAYGVEVEVEKDH
ncbi:Lycopene epsilon cyclase, chloroplastic [Capsicum annuum]|nr:Lycopene epsilon cyclase, chloroplastic [Capsicum annuum]